VKWTVQYRVSEQGKWALQWVHQTRREAVECAQNLRICGYDSRVMRAGECVWPDTHATIEGPSE
jgi:hypothetical protein